ncbi:MAG: DUF4147 domain-containing protein [Gemmatales bacterium]|nr:DUF4147 domain-containing protein [Gemmatales bacterium]MDW8388250.1 DUF4147 domain-containing protein [Gemmatales bacterium]
MASKRQEALAIWQAGVDAVRPERCLPPALDQVARLLPEIFEPRAKARVLLVGGGKAGAAMARVVHADLTRRGMPTDRILGWVNVPRETAGSLGNVTLWPARPTGINYPTPEAVEGTERLLALAASAGPEDVMFCVISGGGSALLPAPVPGVSLRDKQIVTELLHRCGATIQEMNAVRKHLSRIKGGGLVRHFTGRCIISLIISDVIGDPLDVIASGPTAEDPTTFMDALRVLEKYGLRGQVPTAVLNYLEQGAAGQAPETLKALPGDDHGNPRVHNLIVANNARAVAAAAQQAAAHGYDVLNLGSCIAGETRATAEVLGDIAYGQPQGTCILSGGETTVKLPPEHGLGGRNQEFVLACLLHLHAVSRRLSTLTILSGGTDGEDGPTDAAGAVGDGETLKEAFRLGLDPSDFLKRHDSYHFFEQVGGLIRIGLTQTNVMDLRVFLV